MLFFFRGEINMNKKNNKKINIYQMAGCGIFAAMMCVLAPIAIPIGPIPITLGVFVVMLAGIILGWKLAGTAIFVYVLLGFVGLPVFSGGKGGPGVLVGATGGYIWSFILMALWIGFWSQKKIGGAIAQRLYFMAVLISSLILCYFCGTLQFTILTNMPLSQALKACVYPFVLLDIIKAVVAAIIGYEISLRLKKGAQSYTM